MDDEGQKRMEAQAEAERARLDVAGGRNLPQQPEPPADKPDDKAKGRAKKTDAPA